MRNVEPTAVCGAIRPAVISVGVVTGPHPPPPIASMKPPKVPSCGEGTDLGAVRAEAACV